MIFQIDEDQFNKILSLIKEGEKQGAKLVYGGQKHSDEGYYVQPTVFADVEDHHIVATEEVSVQSNFSSLANNWLF